LENEGNIREVGIRNRSWGDGGISYFKTWRIYEEKKRMGKTRSEQPQIRKTAPLDEGKDLGPLYTL
jgi:hypothetical protein